MGGGEGVGERRTHRKAWLMVVECGKEPGSEVWRWAPGVGVLRRRVLSGDAEDSSVLPWAN